MEGLNWKELEQIPIPEGLEERLSAKIDEWEESEKRKVKSEKLRCFPSENEFESVGEADTKTLHYSLFTFHLNLSAGG